jgi:Holliday junction resolvase RusA-like endonuclease
MTTWEFAVQGKPRPKGSMKCLGGRSHNMVEAVESSKPWKLHMIRTIRTTFGIEPVRSGAKVIGFTRGGSPWEPAAGPIMVTATFTFEREMSRDARRAGESLPSHEGAYPLADDIGDLDKLCRNLGDALEQAGLISNDRNITSWAATKRWVLEDAKPGVLVRVFEL